MSNALHDYAKLFEKYAANNGGTGAILAGEDCLALANEMQMDADAIDAESAKLRELCGEMLLYIVYPYVCVRPSVLVERARELGVEVEQ